MWSMQHLLSTATEAATHHSRCTRSAVAKNLLWHIHVVWEDYLCTVDYYSGYFEIDRLEKKTGKSIIKKLKRHFSSQGIPNELFSDNGPPFNSLEFNEFAQQCEFELRKSSSNYPQSNGRVENAVKTAKQLLKKSISAGHEFYLTLLDWRNTPSEGLLQPDTIHAPSEQGKQTRSGRAVKLPSHLKDFYLT